MDGYLSKKPKLSFVDDLGKFYKQRRHATQAKGLETLDPKAEAEGSPESPKETPPPSPERDQHQPPPRTIATGTQDRAMHPDIIDLPIINLQGARWLFKIKVSNW
jgi:hypothetical protein